MAIHAAGPRLFRSIPFRHIAANRKGGSTGGGSLDVRLNVVPFVDMMTILVAFLLMVFATEGALLTGQGGLELPDAARKAKLKQAPIIVVSKSQVAFRTGHEQFRVAGIEEIMESETIEWKIPALFDLMRAEQAWFRGIGGGYEKLSDKERGYCESPKANPKPEEICLDGLVVLQADKSIPVKVLNRVVKTAYAAEYLNIMFAVNRREGR